MDDFTAYYKEQTGGNLGSGIGPVFRSGFVRQRGSGLWQNIWSFVSPLFKSGASALGKQALSTGANILNEAVASNGSPADLKRIAKEKVVQARDSLAAKMKGGGRRRVSRARRTKRKTVKKIRKTKRRARRRLTRTKMDIFSEVPPVGGRRRVYKRR